MNIQLTARVHVVLTPDRLKVRTKYPNKTEHQKKMKLLGVRPYERKS